MQGDWSRSKAPKWAKNHIAEQALPFFPSVLSLLLFITPQKILSVRGRTCVADQMLHQQRNSHLICCGVASLLGEQCRERFSFDALSLSLSLFLPYYFSGGSDSRSRRLARRPCQRPARACCPQRAGCQASPAETTATSQTFGASSSAFTSPHPRKASSIMMSSSSPLPLPPSLPHPPLSKTGEKKLVANCLPHSTFQGPSLCLSLSVCGCWGLWGRVTM